MRTAIFGSAVGAFMHSMWPAAAPAGTSDITASSSSAAPAGTAYQMETAMCDNHGVSVPGFKNVQPVVPHPPAIDPKEFRSFPLVNVYDESPDTKVYRFAFPDGMMQASLKLCSIVLLRCKDGEGNDVVRPYTPISRLDQRGYVEVMVKSYKGAKMGGHLSRMKIGEKIDIKGPYEKLQYVPGQYKKIGMIAGGTGITPMFQLLREQLKTAKPPEVSLIYANKRKEDVLLGSELTELYELHQHFAPYFVLSDPPRDWMGGIGHITKDMVKAFMPPPSRASDSIVLVCGPPGLMKTVSGDKDFTKSPPTQGELTGLLRDLGYPQKMVYKF